METTSQPASIELSFPSELGYEKIAREAVAAFARRLGFEPELIDDLKTALGEACVNAIEHGNGCTPDTRVSIVCNCEGGRLLVEVCDEGAVVFESAPPPVPIEAKLSGLAPARGMGLMIIAQLVDEAGFGASPTGGNRFWFAIRRRLTHAAPATGAP